ncbi:hypothetical protein IRP16_004570 [Salmonella enterica]|nr:hypothetical protein [Salmonella enterica]EGM2345333.1 hypothetical protein [Salmonella enterica]EGM2364164.1 hypothetical protein [Salmonella enterica]
MKLFSFYKYASCSLKAFSDRAFILFPYKEYPVTAVPDTALSSQERRILAARSVC